ncbi:S-layer homology domain-containing protein [Cohnella nanjingensis]|uniref:S-layer homology domain-containing protein n=1 Tax=Cohnella nanjingensis TaxID=1387779 RepID=A0A7X0RXU8_9BACL|nr:S-layer homology domain-containing protein [Cohnella nanjingensis]MBB6675651.1 S-layer homology domain-containing protein [Cohnella nanjingensis]
MTNTNSKFSLLRKSTAATLAIGVLAGSLSGVYADASAKHKEDHDDKDKNKGKSKIELNLNFHDVDEKEWKWAYEHIIRLASQQVFNGYEDGSFKPKEKIKRIEALVAAVRLLGLKEEAEKPENMNAKLNFKDFKEIQKKYPWAIGYLQVALENDLFSENDTSVQPEKPADRLWASILLVKALKLDGEAKKKMDTVLPFRDANQIPAGSVGYVAVAVEKGLITGYSDRTFQPNKPVTRAELAALLDRADGQLPENGNTAIVGTVQSVSNGNLSVKKADGTTYTIPLDAGVFVFRKDVKASPSAIQQGDEALIRTYNGKAVFIEVTKAVDAPVQTTDTGTLTEITYAANKIDTIKLAKIVNNATVTTTYKVSDSLVIADGALTTNKNVTVTIVNNVVTKVQILS